MMGSLRAFSRFSICCGPAILLLLLSNVCGESTLRNHHPGTLVRPVSPEGGLRLVVGCPDIVIRLCLPVMSAWCSQQRARFSRGYVQMQACTQKIIAELSCLQLQRAIFQSTSHTLQKIVRRRPYTSAPGQQGVESTAGHNAGCREYSSCTQSEIGDWCASTARPAHEFPISRHKHMDRARQHG